MSSDSVQRPFGGGWNLPMIGIGTPSGSTNFDPSTVKSAILYAIDIGYRHIQTTVSLNLEQPIGEALIEAAENGIVKSREELFITNKLQYTSNGYKTIIPELRNSLEKLQLKYVDLYLIQWPDCAESGDYEHENIAHNNDQQLMFAWAAMELCQKLGLTKSIGVCNFSSNMLENLLKFAKLPPSVNQVRMHQLWGEKKLREFCLANKISIIASSTIGGKEKHLDITQYMELESLKKLSKHRQKTATQVYIYIYIYIYIWPSPREHLSTEKFHRNVCTPTENRGSTDQWKLQLASLVFL
ncbi:hypothetical protein ACJIZ3_005187 [Penstemon smallii]|uniref:NADP-dependent oxidoreductase domain-containing protein n=1 Tax=Penstemon smallii TaxID=265156 RepID=A0ABD3S4D2_9LAMI